MTLVRLFLLAGVLMLTWTTFPRAHALDPGFLDLRQINTTAWQVFWRKPDVQGAPMTINARLPASCTPATGPEAATDGAAWVSNWTAICNEGLAGQTIVVLGLEKQATDVIVRVQPLDGSPTTQRLTRYNTSYTLPASQSATGLLFTYGALGFTHILEGWDHLLFVLALVLLIPDTRSLIGAITAFTVAHSITLALAALGHLSIPGPPVEAIIALSVVFLAVELIKRRDGETRLSERAPWLVAFAFGLLHGLGFAGALREIGLPDADIGWALLAFNLGVEAGQLAFVFVILSAGFFVRTAISGVGKIPENMSHAGTVMSGYVIGGTAMYWLAERLSGF